MRPSDGAKWLSGSAALSLFKGQVEQVNPALELVELQTTWLLQQINNVTQTQRGFKS